ncbi:MAG: fused MFS/spermidine synthase [Chloroflexi bacterium]|nr:fused MFS/spermidine synthase [Chloroflexota bacterium]
MAVEMSAARLLAPFFGTSLYIWGILIGLMLAYLTAGYWFGGALADRRPRPGLFYGLNAVAACAIALLGLVAPAVLNVALLLTEPAPFGLYLGTIAGCLALFAIPTVLLGTVSPFAIRLRVDRVGAAGRAAGSIFALSTIGSLIGTFAAVFLIIPAIGTRATLYSFAAVLLLAALAGLVTKGKH